MLQPFDMFSRFGVSQCNALQYYLLLEGWVTIDKTLSCFKNMEVSFILVFMSNIQFWHKNTHAV